MSEFTKPLLVANIFRNLMIVLIISIGVCVGGANVEYFSDSGDRPPKQTGRGITLPIVEKAAYARLEFAAALA